MHIRRILAVTTAGVTMLLGAAATATAGPSLPIVMGRYAPVLTSIPGSAKPVAKWTASAQGELNRFWAKTGEPDGLIGRAAVLESFGVKRARIYDVKILRYLEETKTWSVITANGTDAVNEAPTAYAKSYTQPLPLCWNDSGQTRWYQVVSTHAIRRSDNVVTSTRTVKSDFFAAPLLASDPLCAKGALRAGLTGIFDPYPFVVGVPENVEARFEYESPPVSTTADGVELHVTFSDNLTVTKAPPNWVLDNNTSGNNVWEYVEDIPVWQAGEHLETTWEVTPNAAGTGTAEVMATSTTPKVNSGHDTMEFEMVATE
jgi:hypothetical protein